MDLLTPAERQQIRDGLKDALDTFSKTPITIRITNDLSLSPFNEDRTDRPYADYNFEAQVEYNSSVLNKQDTNLAGTWDDSDVRVYIHLDYIEAAGLLVNDYPNIPNNTSELIVLNGNGTREEYRITHVSVGGAFEKRQTYAKILAKRKTHQAS